MPDKINVLVVDDEPIIIMSAERVLKAEGYNVEGALDGKEAMKKIEQNHYDLVLTDLKMLEVDGISLIRWIKQTRPDIGIVIITGLLLQETIKEALKLGVFDHMMKPFTPALLKDVVSKTIEWMRGNTAATDMEEDFSPEMLAELDKVIYQYRKEAGSTLPVLLRAQEIFGYLPSAIQKRIARGLNVFPSEIQSVVSSSSIFRTKPGGSHTIKVCHCSECYVKGSERVLNGIRETLKIDIGETTPDRKFTLDSGRCVHPCGRGPVMVIDHDTHTAQTQRKAISSLGKYSLITISAPPAKGRAGAGKEKYNA